MAATSDSERFLKAKTIFLRAVEKEGRERESYVEHACAVDEELRQDVLRLLRGDLQATEWDETVRAQVDEQLRLLPTEAVSEFPIGEVLGGRYLIRKELGRGAIGATYLAEDRTLYSRPVTVKLLLDTSSRNQYLIDKFKHESEALARITHPGVVSVHDLGTLSDGKPYLVMEFVKGQTLANTLADETRPSGMDFSRAAILIWQIAQALTAAHFEDVVHRDLKPANAMIQSLSDGSEQAKLIDFGIAKVGNPQSAAATQTPVIMGSPSYMAPEQVERCEASPASDIYSLGVLAYEMLTGQRPFAVDTRSISWPTELVNMQRAGVSTKPKSLRPDLSEAAQAEILKALSYNPGHRHQKAFELGAGLYRALTNERRADPFKIGFPSLTPGASSQPGTLLFDPSGPGAKPVSPGVVAFERFWSHATFTDRIRPLPPESAKDERKQQHRGMGAKPKRAQYAYRLGAELCLALDIKRDGHLTLLDEGPEGKIYCLCPSQFAPNTKLESGRIYLPQEAAPHEAFELSGVPGKERLLAIVSDEPLELDWLSNDAEAPARVLSSNDIDSLFARLQQLGEGRWTALSSYFEVTG
jgi:serine/threonine protein kinase